MSFGDFIEQQFPGVKWTGSSSIHRSRSGNLFMPSSTHEVSKLMELAHNGAMGLALWDFLQKHFEAMDWQVTAEEFRAIILTDIERHLTGKGDTQLPTKIKNPNTGNVFHRLATRGEIVGGVRVWHEQEGLKFGFRFRLARMTPDEHTSVPLIARQKAIASIKVAEQVVHNYKIAEPSIEETKKLRESVQVK